MSIMINDNGFDLPSIDGIVCTYQTKEIRSEIEKTFHSNKTFPLPEKYTYEITPSQFWGNVAKIIKKNNIVLPINNHIKNLN